MIRPAVEIVAELDALSRTRALTDEESYYLQRALYRLGEAPRPSRKPNGAESLAAMSRREDGEKAAIIIAEVAQEVGITADELLSRRQRFPLAQTRRRLWARLQSETGTSIAQIGRWTNRDHSTVLHGLKAMGALA